MKKSKRHIKHLIAVIIAIVTVFSVPVNAASYVYDYEENVLKTPDAVTVKYYADTAYSGFSKLSQPQDLAVDSKGNFYIADSGNNRIVVLDSMYKYKTEYSAAVMPDGTLSALKKPTGIYVCDNGEIYIADCENNRVVVVDESFNYIKEMSATAEEVLKEEFTFKPSKVAANEDGRTYVIAEGVYDGLMEFNTDGEFVAFSGSAEVSYDILDVFWMKFGTEAQRKQLTKNIPTEFSGLDIDASGFVYTVNASVEQHNPYESEPIRKQNNLGNNILKFIDELKNPIGDILYPYSSDDAEVTGPSQLVDISANCSFGYVALDAKRGHIFVYSDHSEIMFVFGGMGSSEGSFTLPVAVCCYGDEIAVLDSTLGSVTVFSFTEYAQLIIKAQKSYSSGDYDTALNEWNEVLKINSNLNMAYTNIGKILIRQGKYEQALSYLEYGQNKTYYSKAYKYYRKETLTENIAIKLVVAALVLAAAVFLIKFLLKLVHKKFGERKWYTGLKYSFHIMTHPFDGFWDMIHENKGNMVSALILYGLFVLSMIIKSSCSGFLLSPLGESFNLLATVALSTLPILLYCVCNWSITTLFDGYGKFSHICMSFAYCLTPYILVSIPITVIGNFVTLEETAILNVISAIAIVWCVFLLFSAMITIHGYTGVKAIGTMVATVIAMLIVIMLAALLFNLVQQMVMFIVSIYDELTKL